jgi:hypothetical protein
LQFIKLGQNAGRVGRFHGFVSCRSSFHDVSNDDVAFY